MQRPDTHMRMDSFMDGEKDSSAASEGKRAGSGSSAGEGEFAERKQRRMSRFREELDAGDD